ncbi:hypothetical protein HN51_015086 [Arachis hypogaea]
MLIWETLPWTNADDIIPNVGVTNVSAKKAMTPILSRTTLEPEFQPPISEVLQALVQLLQRANMSRRTTFGSDQGGSNRGSDVPAIHDDM